jgi:hypothetical protein
MKIRRTSDPDISYWEHDNSALRWAYNIKEFRIDTRNREFILTPIGWDDSEGPIIDATEMYEQFLREER